MGDLSISQKLEENKGVQIVKIAGFLDSHTVTKLERILQGLISDGMVKIVIDFSELDYISSAGLGVFMSVITPVRTKRGDIVLAAMSPKIAKIFALLGFTQIFKVVDSVSEALLAFT